MRHPPRLRGNASSAVVCTIEVVAGDGTEWLRVSNDGVPGSGATGGGSGSGWPTGQLACTFELTAESLLAWPP